MKMRLSTLTLLALFPCSLLAQSTWTFEQNIQVDQNLNVDGLTTLQTLNITGDVTTVGNLALSNGNVTIDGDITLTGAGRLILADGTTLSGVADLGAPDQQLQISGNTLTLTGTGGNSITLPSGGGTGTVDRFQVSSGQNNNLNAANTFAIGNNNTLNQNGAFAFGSNNSVVATGSGVMGQGHTVDSLAAASFGIGTANHLMGNSNLALGYNHETEGLYSFAIGVGGQALGSAGWNVNDPLLVVGNTPSGAINHHALVIRKDGNVGIGNFDGTDTQPDYVPLTDLNERLVVDGNIRMRGDGDLLLTNPGNEIVFADGSRLSSISDLEMPVRVEALEVSVGNDNSVFTASMAVGSSNTLTTGNAATIGTNNTVGAAAQNSLVVGDGNDTTGRYTFVMGRDNTVGGESAGSLGRDNIVTGAQSFAFGRANLVPSINSVAIGNDNNLLERNSYAIGINNLSSGWNTTSLGTNLEVEAFCSLALGTGGQARGDIDSWIITEPLLVIGNTPNINLKRNAMVVRKDGNIGIGNFGGTDTEPDYLAMSALNERLVVSGNIRLEGSGARLIFADGSFLDSATGLGGGGGGSGSQLVSATDVNSVAVTVTGSTVTDDLQTTITGKAVIDTAEIARVEPRGGISMGAFTSQP